MPDESARIETYTYFNPRPASWPAADFVVGNPPFIGNKRLRDRLGWGYVSALFAAYPDVERSSDFVMYWWHRAASQLFSGTRRFGLVTTNSIRQSFNRRTLSAHIGGRRPIHLDFAIPDHPWVNSDDAAAVRIAMTVCSVGHHSGTLRMVASEKKSDDGFDLVLTDSVGHITAMLSLGPNLSELGPLQANNNLCAQGVKVVGDGFYVDDHALSDGRWAVGEAIRLIVGAQELVGRSQIKRRIIDFFGLTQEQARSANALAYQKVLNEVKPVRDINKRDSIRTVWWRFAWERPVLRAGIAGLSNYIVTPETSRHRLYWRLPSDVVPDGTLFGIAIDEWAPFTILHSRQHAVWTLTLGNQLGPTPRFNNTNCFDPFPFPVSVVERSTASRGLEELGQRLDAFRRERLAAHDFLTVTSLYNVLERIRELENGAPVEPLSDKERDIHEAGLVSVLKEVHDDIDRAVFGAYGWDDLIPDLVGKPGATTPSPHKSPAQEAAEEELLTRLVALNKERAAEEARGLVRWLRPEYQIPRLGKKVAAAEGDQLEVDVAVSTNAQRPKWPGDAFEQIKLVRDVLAKAPAPMPVDGIAVSFDGRLTDKRRGRVRQVLDTLVATGAARMDASGQGYFVPR